MKHGEIHMPKCDWCRDEPEAIVKVLALGKYETNFCARHKTEIEMGEVLEIYNEEKLDKIMR